MIKKLIVFVCVIKCTGICAQVERKAGMLELGLRNTYSVFGAENTAGVGVGGQFRLMMGKRLNTEWFADYIQNDLYNLGKRNDAHIGWSVMFYLRNTPKKLDPYILAGHCFDYTRVTIFNTLIANNAGETQKRWSSAVQLGIGSHLYMGRLFNVSASAQYMVHLGKDIHTHLHNDGSARYLEIETHETNNKLTFEGHLLFTLSMNFKIAELW